MTDEGRTMKPRTMAAAAMAVAAMATGAAGQECEAGRADCFALWTGCAPIGAIVSPFNNEIGLQRADVMNAVESRLRAARVYSPDDRPETLILRIQLWPTTDLFTVDLVVSKNALRDRHGNTGRAEIWVGGFWSAHGGRVAFVMEGVRRELDEFMNKFLRVNGPACERGDR